MARKIPIVDSGNFGTAGTWGTTVNTTTMHASTSLGTNSTRYTIPFTAPNTTNALLQVAFFMSSSGASASGTINVQLQANSAGWVDVAGVAQTYTVDTVYTVADTWINFVFPTPYTYTATTADYYRFKITQTGSFSTNPSLFADSTGTTVCYYAVDNRTGVPASTDDILIVGNCNATRTVIVDGAYTFGSGSGTKNITPVARTLTNALDLGQGGILYHSRSANTQLTILGNQVELAGGKWDMGTIADPIPAPYTVKIIQSQPTASADFTFRGRDYGAGFSAVCELPTYIKTKFVSGTGTVADPLITADPVDWAVGTEILICANSNNALNYHESQLFTIVTKNSSTSFVIIGNNIIDNGGFDYYSGSTFQGWTNTTTGGTIAADTGVVHGGLASVKLSRSTATPYMYYTTNNIDALPSGKYTLKFWTKGDGTNAGQYRVRDATNSVDIKATTTTGVTGDWTEVTYQFTAPATCKQLAVYVYGPTVNSSYAYFDDLTITLDETCSVYLEDAEILNLTRNIVFTTDNYLRAGGFANAILDTTRTKYVLKGVRSERITYSSASGACGTIPLGAAGTSATMDDCVFYKWLSYLYLLSSKTVETFSRNFFVYSDLTSSGLSSSAAANKTFDDCYWVKRSGVGLRIETSNKFIINRGVFISNNMGRGAASGATGGNGSYGCEFNDCEFHCNYMAVTPLVPNFATFNACNIGTKGKNFFDCYIAADVVGGALFKNCMFDPISLVGNYLLGGDGTEFIFHRYNDTDNYHFWYNNYGKAQCVGAGLADTTVRTANSLGLRIAPEEATTGFIWEFKIFQKANSIVNFFGYFMKNAAFSTDDAIVELWLDGSTTADATFTLADITTWQACSLSAQYTGDVDTLATIRVTAKSATSGAYLYCDDLFNSGDTVQSTDKVTGLDTWFDGKPVEIIAPQAVSPADIWTFSTLNLTTANTTGCQLNKIKKITGWLRGLL